MSDSLILRIVERLVDQAHLDDLEGLHDKDLSPSSDGPTNKTSEKFNVVSHSSIFYNSP